MTAEFKPTLGKKGFDAVHSMLAFDDPNRNQHLGSAFDGGWYGYVSKDLRTLLGAKVRGRYSRVYCGKGSLAKCRKALLHSLDAALHHDSDSDLYPEGSCTLFGGIHGDAAGVLGLHPLPRGRRHHPARGALGEPADLPADRRDQVAAGFSALARPRANLGPWPGSRRNRSASPRGTRATTRRRRSASSTTSRT